MQSHAQTFKWTSWLLASWTVERSTLIQSNSISKIKYQMQQESLEERITYNPCLENHFLFKGRVAAMANFLIVCQNEKDLASFAIHLKLSGCSVCKQALANKVSGSVGPVGLSELQTTATQLDGTLFFLIFTYLRGRSH